ASARRTPCLDRADVCRRSRRRRCGMVVGRQSAPRRSAAQRSRANASVRLGGRGARRSVTCFVATEDRMVTKTADAQARSTWWNLPNQITFARLVVSILVFVAIHFEQYLTGLVLFVIAAGTDWIDGRLARSMGLVSQLGRVMDP